MSDTITVTIFSTGGAVVIALIGWLSKKQKPSHQSKIVPQTITASIPITANITLPEVQQPPRRTTILSHTQMSDAIEAVPPLQQDGIEASFIDLYITWKGTLFGASRLTNSVSVSLDDICLKGGLAHCSAQLHECDELLVAPKGTEIVVTGKIKSISKHDVMLEDCSFKVIHTPAD